MRHFSTLRYCRTPYNKDLGYPYCKTQFKNYLSLPQTTCVSRIKSYGRGLPKLKGRGCGSSQVWPHILGMSTSLGYTNCKAQGKNYHEFKHTQIMRHVRARVLLPICRIPPTLEDQAWYIHHSIRMDVQGYDVTSKYGRKLPWNC